MTGDLLKKINIWNGGLVTNMKYKRNAEKKKKVPTNHYTEIAVEKIFQVKEACL